MGQNLPNRIWAALLGTAIMEVGAEAYSGIILKKRSLERWLMKWLQNMQDLRMSHERLKSDWRHGDRWWSSSWDGNGRKFQEVTCCLCKHWRSRANSVFTHVPWCNSLQEDAVYSKLRCFFLCFCVALRLRNKLRPPSRSQRLRADRKTAWWTKTTRRRRRRVGVKLTVYLHTVHTYLIPIMHCKDFTVVIIEYIIPLCLWILNSDWSEVVI